MLKAFRAWWRARRNARKAKRLTRARAQWDKRFSDKAFDAAAITKVALLRWDDKLGDAITCTLFISALTQHRSDIEITVLTGKNSAQLLANIPGNVKVEVLGKRGWETAKALNQFAGQFDLVVELGSSLGDRDLFALYQLQAAHYLGYGKEDYQLFDLTLAPEKQHFADRYLAAAKLLCPEAALEKHFYVLKDSASEKLAQDFFNGLASNGPTVVINLFGSAAHRQFNETEAKDLLQWWHQQFPTHALILLRVPGKDDFLEKLAADASLQLTPGPASLALTMAVLRQADMVFSPDTSVVHFAGALNKPLVAVYNNNPRNFSEWAPLSTQQAVVFSRPPAMANDKVRVAEFSRDELAQAISRLAVA